MRLTTISFLNASSNLIIYAVKLGINIVITPVLVTSFGTTLFGVWSVLTRLSNYLAAVDGRSTQALKWTIANTQYDDDQIAKKMAVGSAVGVWVCMLPLLLLFGGLVVWLAPKVAGAPLEMYSVVRLATFILVVTFIFSGLLEIPSVILAGENMSRRRLGGFAGSAIAGGVATWGLVSQGGGLCAVALVRFAVAILTTFILYRVVRRHVPWFGIILPQKKDLTKFIKFIKLSGWFFAWYFTFMFLTKSDLLILSLIKSADAVTTYTLTGMAATAMTSLLLIIMSSVTPGLAGIIGAGDFGRANRIRNDGMTIAWTLVTISGGCIIAHNASFVDLWVGNIHFGGWLTNILFVVIMAQFVMFNYDSQIIDTTLDLKHKILLTLISGITSLLLSIAFVPYKGIDGLCAAIFLGRMLLTISYPRIIIRFLGQKSDTNFLAWLRRIPVTVIVFASGFWFSQNVTAGGWFSLIIWSIVTFITFSLIVLTIGLSLHERNLIIQILFAMVNDIRTIKK